MEKLGRKGFVFTRSSEDTAVHVRTENCAYLRRQMGVFLLRVSGELAHFASGLPKNLGLPHLTLETSH